MQRLSEYVKAQDQFPHLVHIRYRKDGSNEYKTFLGGFVSTIIKSLMIVYTFKLVNKMVTFDGDTNSTVELQTLKSEQIRLIDSKMKFSVKV